MKIVNPPGQSSMVLQMYLLLRNCTNPVLVIDHSHRLILVCTISIALDIPLSSISLLGRKGVQLGLLLFPVMRREEDE